MPITRSWQRDLDVEAELERSRKEMANTEAQRRLDQAWKDAEEKLARLREEQREGEADDV